VIVVALGALMLPLSRIVPPLYVWQVRSRVYRWYGQLRAVEQALEQHWKRCRMKGPTRGPARELIDGAKRSIASNSRA
jgi:hypothetical protein